MSEGLSSHVTTLETFPWQVVSGRWESDATRTFQPATGLLHVPQVKGTPASIASSCTFVRDPWAIDPRQNVRTVEEARKPLSIDALGWTRERAAQVRARLSSFAEDWDDPEMDIYDE